MELNTSVKSVEQQQEKKQKFSYQKRKEFSSQVRGGEAKEMVAKVLEQFREQKPTTTVVTSEIDE